MKTLFKLSIALVLLMGLFTTTVQAQVKVGIRAGLNVANWRGETTESARSMFDFASGAITTESRQGFHAGTYLSIPFGERFLLEPALLYSQKGYTLRGTLNNSSSTVVDLLNPRVTVQNRAHYVELPVMAKVFLSEGFHLFGGPQVAYLVDNEVRARASVLGVNVLNQDMAMNAGFQKWDAGLVGGLGYQFGNGLNISAAYEHGLQRLDEAKRFNAYNQVMKFSIGYTF